MNPYTGWTLAVLALAAATYAYGWQGAVFATTVIVFWLLLQFNRVLRTMRRASESPVGHVASAVMLHARLRAGMPMLDIVKFTRSLGRRLTEQPEVWAWSDASGAQVAITFEGGRCRHWALTRSEPPDPDAGSTANAQARDAERQAPSRAGGRGFG